MCKFNPKNDSRFIDPCMKKFMTNLKYALVDGCEIKASCCGHGKYHMTIVIFHAGTHYDLVSGFPISRKKRFYKKDEKGMYLIPEVENYYKKDKRNLDPKQFALSKGDEK